jgi:putative membrane-bound dehydrogenase-like protein
MNRRWLVLTLIALAGLLAPNLGAQPAGPGWQLVRVPGAWETNGPPAAQNHDGFAWYRAWLKPHDSFFTPHERNLFAESVTLNVRDLADAHEIFVNGTRVGGGGMFPPQFSSGRAGNHRHKIPPGLLRKGEWNEISVRVFNASGPGGFLGEAPFVMDYFNECVMEGGWEWRAGDDPAWKGAALKEKPGRAAFETYRESNRVLGEAAQFVHGPKLSPADSAAKLKPADDLVVEQLLQEPLVAQPTHLSYDARGRLWVAQYRQYPYPAGVKMLSRDKYYRAHYDKVPPAPPNHDRGRDVISIHEDTDGDGVFDKHKIFVDGLNMANAALPGRDGVWIMHTPYLLFYPDRDGDDVPDGPPTVHLAGFGLEDTHSVANGLAWGPDGWIYGAQGSTTSSRVVRPGIDVSERGVHAASTSAHIASQEQSNPNLAGTVKRAEARAPRPEGVYFEGCMVWRYHPVTRAYEIFAEGSGNVFGLEFDGEGRLFSGHNGAETRGWHYLQGGYYMKQGVDPGKFGPPRNPYAFGELPWMKLAAPIQRFTHMLAVVEGTAMPETRQGQLFWVDPVHSLLLATERQTRGSTFGTRDLDQVLKSADDGFRPVYIVNAPDGSLHIADFYEHYIAHGQHYQSQIDPTTGRIYRLRGKGRALEKDVSLARKNTDELLALLSHPNKWHRQTAARILGWRATPEVTARLRSTLTHSLVPIRLSERGQTNGDKRMERAEDRSLAALWALHQAGGLDEATALAVLKHPSAPVREWTIRLLGDRNQLSDRLAVAVQEQARAETNVRVRAQMASSARRLPAEQALSLVATLFAHDEDNDDPCVPLLCWWVLETHLAQNRDAILALFQSTALWEHPLVREHILSRLMRRFAVEGRRQDLIVCARLLRTAPSPRHSAQLMKGFEEAYRGRAMTGLPDELLTALAATGNAPLVLRLRQREAGAVDEALAQIQDARAKLEDRLLYTRTLGEVREPRAVKPLLSLAMSEHPAAVRKAALAALTAYEDDAIGTSVAAALPGLAPDVRASALALLVSRSVWSLALLQSAQAKQLDLSLVPPDIADRLRLSKEKRVSELAAKLLPRGSAASTAGLQQRITEVEAILKHAPGNPYSGEALFTQRCAACHKLFFKGGDVGPDLTAYQRDNLGTLLISILNPNAEIREGYAYVEIETTDGRELGGFLTDCDAQVTVLRGLDGQDVTLRAADIRSIEPTGRSLMPEGLLDDLKNDQLRDLFAYLRSSQPFSR